MDKRKIQIKIDPQGKYTFIAKEGFEGSACTEKTKQIELVLGGTPVASGKTNDYYKPDAPNSIDITFS